MNESLHFWIQRSKNDKLDALRDEAQRLQRQHDALVAKLERVMAYFGVCEETGPRVVPIRAVVENF